MVSPEMAASSSTKAVKSIAVIATSGIGPYAASTLGRQGQAHRYSKSSLPLARKTRNGQVLSNRTSKNKPMILLTI
jgi:hypothetical protein